jgi:SAM-dependent methyltransferase
MSARITRDQLLAMAGPGAEKVLIDLGCGTRKRAGYIGVDKTKLAGVDVVCDFEAGLPFENDTVDGIWANFLFEHVANLISLFQELYRVCRKDAIIECKVPYYQSVTQYKDPTHRSFITPQTIRYFGEEKWYGSDYKIGVNFKLLRVDYQYLPPFDRLMSKKLFILRPIVYPFILFGRRFLWNIVHSIRLTIQVQK